MSKTSELAQTVEDQDNTTGRNPAGIHQEERGKQQAHKVVGTGNTTDVASSAPRPLHVVAVGDSTIDNLIWMDRDDHQICKVQDCVIGRLRAALPKGTRVTNLAADGFTSTNVLHGAEPLLSRAAWRAAGEPFPCADGEPLRPLDLISDLTQQQQQQQPTHVLLSVGGNDVREILSNMHQLPQVLERFQTNYRKICDRILAMTHGSSPKLVLLLQYQVSLKHEHGGYGVYGAMSSLPGPGTGPQKLQALMERVYAPVLKLAKQHRLAVIDLPRTFDPANAELYRLQIEPSAKGSDLIAAVVSHALATHDFTGPSRLYSKSLDAESDTGSSGGRTFCSEVNDFDDARPWTIVRSGEPTSSQSILPETEMSAQLAARGAHVQALPHAVAGLMEMGFSEDKVKAALAKCGNLPQQALELLLSENNE